VILQAHRAHRAQMALDHPPGQWQEDGAQGVLAPANAACQRSIELAKQCKNICKNCVKQHWKWNIVTGTVEHEGFLKF